MNAPLIDGIEAREVLDSRGNPTVAVLATTSDGAIAEAMVPSGASTGANEAVELRDGDERYGGKGVRKAVQAVNEVLGPEIGGMEVTAQRAIDDTLVGCDGTANKSRFGANAILGISLAVARAAAASLRQPLYKYLGNLAGNPATMLPVPMMNVINGGKHAEGALEFQECMIVPVGASNEAEAVRYGAEVFHAIGKILHERKMPTLVGDEGGYAPPLETPQQALDLIVEAIQRAGYKPGKDLAIALDPASSEFYQDGKYFPLSRDRAVERRRHDRTLHRIVRSLSDRFDRRRAGRRRLGGLAKADGRLRRTRATGRRRSLRDQREVSAARHRGESAATQFSLR